MNFGLAVILIAAIWAILITALVIWYLVARSRRKATPETPGPLRQGAMPSSDAADGGLGSPSEALPLGSDLTQPVERLPQRPPSFSADPEQFGLTTQRDYERLASEPFQAPPATALGERRRTERFSWAEASQSGSRPPSPTGTNPTVDLADPSTPSRREDSRGQTPPPPSHKRNSGPQAAPTAAARIATGITTEPVAPADDDLDRTVVVSREAAARVNFGWSLVLPDGDALRLGPECVVGRRPSADEGATPVVIADPTRTLSKSHARLRYDGERWWVIDLGSTNGLWLLHANGGEEEVQPYEEVEATPRLRLGTLEVELHEA